MSSDDVIGVLERAGASYERLPHAHTESASAEADALGLSPDEVAKTVVLKTPAGFVRGVLPASCRLDVRKVAGVVGESRKRVDLATEDELAGAYSEFELGAVPPFGGAQADRVIVDRRVAGLESVVLEAGSHDESIRIRTADLLGITQADVADICED